MGNSKKMNSTTRFLICSFIGLLVFSIIIFSLSFFGFVCLGFFCLFCFETGFLCVAMVVL